MCLGGCILPAAALWLQQWHRWSPNLVCCVDLVCCVAPVQRVLGCIQDKLGQNRGTQVQSLLHGLDAMGFKAGEGEWG